MSTATRVMRCDGTSRTSIDVEALGSNVHDPWAVMFDGRKSWLSARRRGDIVPYWVYEGASSIERYVPMLPMSREIDQLERLKKSLAVYRMVFGQPRQEDLVAWLAERFSPDELARFMDDLRIDLSPPLMRPVMRPAP